MTRKGKGFEALRRASAAEGAAGLSRDQATREAGTPSSLEGSENPPLLPQSALLLEGGVYPKSPESEHWCGS